MYPKAGPLDARLIHIRHIGPNGRLRKLAFSVNPPTISKIALPPAAELWRHAMLIAPSWPAVVCVHVIWSHSAR